MTVSGFSWFILLLSTICGTRVVQTKPGESFLFVHNGRINGPELIQSAME